MSIIIHSSSRFHQRKTINTVKLPVVARSLRFDLNPEVIYTQRWELVETDEVAKMIMICKPVESFIIYSYFRTFSTQYTFFFF